MKKIIMTILKKDTNSLSSLTLVWTIIGSGSVNICIEKFEYFKRLNRQQEERQIFQQPILAGW